MTFSSRARTLPSADDTAARPWLLRRAVLGLVLAGALVQVLMSAYYLSVAHAPRPHGLPVGYVAAAQTAAQVKDTLVSDGQFRPREYPSTAAMAAAVRRREVYGGVDLTTQPPQLLFASAAGTAAATALRTAFTTAVQQQTAQRVGQLVAAGTPVAPGVVQQLTAPPAVTDVVALPADDRAGSSLSLLVQALAIGATVASMGLGRLGADTRPSVSRGLGHVTALLVYALGSAVAVLLTARAFGVVPAGAGARLFGSFLLLSVAITGSVAGLVGLIGRSGSFLGTAYFLFGVPIAGATVLQEFLPPVARTVGQALPTGAASTLLRDALYFPAASTTRPVTVLCLYAGVGLVAVLVTNTLATRSARSSTPSSPESL